ncbi:sigma-70 family RNA polymerase sigma factor [Varunaivibrio sulfuroxidans]|uniref:RNA polymerase sigma-70 factor (ECF subfamily) n=1 Tax=Varunaivibrio sulfuroxidans TaxID=1773489 RepID=A0A4R3J6J7_9PROT|nr:sigma-70 family RNA polymerase sigma factor [Varunaivibrio sulfuroxidans]TCS60964.1 RNA polymerase sigma-70 factor (ECF subfamily) [Varunaivibrio sulfuroxidans]WES31630.1 sigma-70 family RNA polymerase sigma factor [Varunaivibrio sulfuroxidans]
MDERTRKELVILLPRLRRFALGLTRSLDEADDLVQCACEKAISRFDQWQQGTRLDSWMFRIIQNAHIDVMRARTRKDRVLEPFDNQPEPGHDGAQAMESRMTLRNVRDAILRLPEEQRAVIMLVSVEGYSYKDAAENLGIPVGTLTSRLVRGRTALLNLLDGETQADDALVGIV